MFVEVLQLDIGVRPNIKARVEERDALLTQALGIFILSDNESHPDQKANQDLHYRGTRLKVLANEHTHTKGTSEPPRLYIKGSK